MPVSIALEMTKALPEWPGQSLHMEHVSKQTQTKTETMSNKFTEDEVSKDGSKSSLA